MTTLPPAFDPWLPWLRERSRLTEEVLGAWLPRLARAVGPVAARREPDPAGEPTGYAGLTNRGPYDRLLLAEWLLADELPDEFLRRATAGEHLFVELDKNRPHRAPWTVVLCDAGPDQLGAPRLVQLAMIVAIAMRPRAPERLVVGALQAREPWEPGLSPEAGRQLGAARTRSSPRREDVRHWQDWIRAQGGDAPEIWVLGGPEARGLPLGRANRMVIEEDWRSAALSVAVHRADGTTVRAELSPPPSSAGRVLSDPFGPRVHARPFAEGDLSATYAAGRWLFVRDRGRPKEVVAAVASPKEVRQTTKCVGVHNAPADGAFAIAAGRVARGLVSVWADGDDLVVLGLIGAGRSRLPRPAGFAVDRAAPLQPLGGSGQGSLVLADPTGRVWTLALSTREAASPGRTVGPMAFAGGHTYWSDGQRLHRWALGSVFVVSGPWPRFELLTPGTLGAAVALHQGAPQLYQLAGGAMGMSGVEWAERLSFPGVFPARGIMGLLDGRLRTCEGEELDLGPDAVIWAGADPEGYCYAVLFPAEVRFYGPDGRLLTTWSPA